jgi:hypothetical protein
MPLTSFAMCMLCRDTRPESQQADRYIPFWVERLEQTATQQQQPWPVGMLQSHWRDVCSMGYIRFHHRQCRFPLSCKNDVLLCFTPFNSDAIMGVEMKKKLDDQVSPGLAPHLAL